MAKDRDAQANLEFSKDEIKEIPFDQIEADKNQLRKEFKEDELEALAESIKNDGQIQPILITQGEGGKYKIVDGERRWRACKALAEQAKADTESQTEITCTIRAIYVDGDNQRLGILGNIVRNSYNPMETADALSALKALLGKEATDADVGKYTGKSRSLITEYFSLLKLPKEIQDKARNNSCVPFNKLKALAAKKIPSDDKIIDYEALHVKYSTDKKPKKDDIKQRQSKYTRKLVDLRKKVVGINTALVGIKLDKITKAEESVKKDFIESLESAKKTVENLIKQLSQQVPNKD